MNQEVGASYVEGGRVKNAVINLNPDPLLSFGQAAVYLGYKNGRCLSVALSRKKLGFLKDNMIYVGSRPAFRISVLEKYLHSRTAKNLAAAGRES